jgi:uncharacterized membrane protein YbjE (DUF340 family)
MWQLLTLLGALLIGYSVRKLPLKAQLLNQTLFLIVILILFVMGYEFGSSTSDLWGQLALIGKNVLVFGGLLFGFNLFSANLILAKENRSLRVSNQTCKQANYWQFAQESGKYVLIIALGVTTGLIFKQPLSALAQIINLLLFILLFVIGHQMRVGGVALKDAIFNKTGIKLAATIIVSSLVAGIVAALILNIPLRQGLMLSSGFGWYTLSSILDSQLINQEFGTTAFFIDFSRELVAIIFLPSLGRYFPVSLVGYCGGTAMDFSLPIIKQNLHAQCVILAISSGMILSLAVPILIPLFAHF